MPVPVIVGTNGGILGGIRSLLLADPNVFTACGRNRIRPWKIPGPDTTNTEATDPTDDGYPFIALGFVGGKSEVDSTAMEYSEMIVQVSVFGEGYFPTELFARQVKGLLARKKVDNVWGTPTYLRFQSGIVPMPDPERSTTAKDVYHAPLRFACLDCEQESVLPYIQVPPAPAVPPDDFCHLFLNASQSLIANTDNILRMGAVDFGCTSWNQNFPYTGTVLQGTSTQWSLTCTCIIESPYPATVQMGYSKNGGMIHYSSITGSLNLDGSGSFLAGFANVPAVAGDTIMWYCKPPSNCTLRGAQSGVTTLLDFVGQ